MISGLITARGTPHQLMRACRDGLFRLVISAPLLAEYERVLNRPKFSTKYGLSEEHVAAFLGFVRTSGLLATPRRRLPLRVRDPKDEHILATALGGRADYLVTGDDDLLVLRDEPALNERLKIVTAVEFLALVLPE